MAKYVELKASAVVSATEILSNATPQTEEAAEEEEGE